MNIFMKPKSKRFLIIDKTKISFLNVFIKLLSREIVLKSFLVKVVMLYKIQSK
jgi:hypothetical protein